jgi:hypothetical protein
MLRVHKDRTDAINLVDAANDFGDIKTDAIYFLADSLRTMSLKGGPLSLGERRQTEFLGPTATTFQTFS